MNRRIFILGAAMAAVLALVTSLRSDEPLPKDPKNLSFRNEVRDIMNRGTLWLAAQQNPDGTFGKDVAHPALTALAVVALQKDPSGKYTRSPAPENMQKAYSYLRKFAQPDGGIYNPESGLANYNTSVGLLALLGANDPQDEELLR